MPAASALSENAIVLYTGTTGTYVSGQFYMCVNTGSGYEWQTVTISGTEEDTYTADRALVTNSLGQVTASGITAEELGYLSGATSPLQAQINGKVTAVSGMGLSQNSYTTDEKNKLAGIAAGAQVNVIEAVQRNGSAVPVSGKTVNIAVPVALSELTNDKGFIDSTVENLANFYTKSEVNSLVSTIPKFAVQVVASLPGSGQSATTIYLTPNSGSSGNVYDEYLWVNNAWEKIGSTQVSFTLDQDGNSIVINGTTLKDASSTSAGLMSITSYNDLQTAKSNISTLGTRVSGLESRLTTAESTLSTTVSRVTTCESNIITSGQVSESTLQLNQQGGGRIDIPLPEKEKVYFCGGNGIHGAGGMSVHVDSQLYSISPITMQSLSDTNVGHGSPRSIPFPDNFRTTTFPAVARTENMIRYIYNTDKVYQKNEEYIYMIPKKQWVSMGDNTYQETIRPLYDNRGEPVDTFYLHLHNVAISDGSSGTVILTEDGTRTLVMDVILRNTIIGDDQYQWDAMLEYDTYLTWERCSILMYDFYVPGYESTFSFDFSEEEPMFQS